MRRLTLSLLAPLLLVPAACTEKQAPPPPVPEEAVSVRERAEAVGAVGDATVTVDLQKGLTGVVDANEKRAEELEEAGRP
ncbi:MAG: hypothetical protein HQK87_05390 [Nitrospinae bacterium]|nr:hypothetical protein [Nitrospinota bacterium]